MPELPEVQTTVNSLKRVLLGLRIKAVWTDLAVKKPSLKHFNDTLKSLAFFKRFKKEVVDQKVVAVERRGKNILINIGSHPSKILGVNKNKTILIHMKMTGNLLYGRYQPGDKFIHVIFDLSNKKQLALRDVRKFGKVTLLNSNQGNLNLGPEPLDKNFTFDKFLQRLNLRKNGKIKIVLIDQRIIAGIGNIYSDEILWLAGIHPEEKVARVGPAKLKKMFWAIKDVLKKGIRFGGDSTSDYRNIFDKPGRFQYHHQAYQRNGKKCAKNDGGVIIKIKVAGRSAHFCPKHQRPWKR